MERHSLLRYLWYVGIFTCMTSATPATAPSPAEWTILVFIQGCSNLESFVHANLKDMIAHAPLKGVNLLAEVHRPGPQAWRYSITPGQATVEETIPRATLQHDTIEKEVLDACKWAYKKFPAKKHALILWNHGSGAVDFKMEGRSGYGYRTSSRTSAHSLLPTTKGILYDEDRNAYLKNEHLKNLMARISSEALQGKKIDVVGMDACNMAMLEVAYQLKEHVKHMVASQEYELAQGWPYATILPLLNKPALSGEELSTIIVQQFGECYKKRTHYYTQSSINLEHIDLLKENIDQLSHILLQALRDDKNGTRKIVQRARMQCLSFSIADYVDMSSFYSELLRVIQQYRQHGNVMNPLLNIPSYLLDALEKTLKEGITLVEQITTSNATGRYLQRAKGISLYFPQRGIDESYVKTHFAQSSTWPRYLYAHLSV